MAEDQIGPAPDVTILGAGIVGIMTALSLTERGFRVALIDRNPPAELSLIHISEPTRPY